MVAASGVVAADALDKGLRDLFSDLSGRRLEGAIAAALDSGVSSFLTHSLHPNLFPLKTRTGRPLIHDVSVRPLGVSPGGHCLLQISDVTVAAERERVLRQRQDARYAAAVDNAPDPILTTDESGVIQLANPAAALALGYEPSLLIDRPIAELFEDAEAWNRVWLRVASGEPVQPGIELVARRADGSASYVGVSAARWLNETRSFITVILRDTNERHAAEAALRRLNETLEERVAATLAERKLLADIVETTDAFIQVVDTDYRLMAVNRASAKEFERAFGVRPKVGDNVIELMAALPLEQASARSLWSRALAGEEFTTVQRFGPDTDGARYYELKFDALHDGSGRQIAAFQFVYDVTERLEREAQLIRTEEALRQSQKMEAIGQLTGGIAHDFNNLLMGITGSMDILRRRIAAGRFHDTERFLDAATASANRAAALTHRLLAFARRQPLDPKAVDVNHLIGGIEDLIRRTLGEQVTLVTEMTADPWPIRSDPNQLENAVLNLAINARDAMVNGGRLTISTRNVEMAEPVRNGPEEIAGGDYLVICVSDTGAGIEPDLLERVVEPFFTTKPLGQGTGLGLSMIYGFVKQTGGHVRIESTVGVGTQVRLYFPRFIGTVVDEDAEAAGRTPAGSGETVLLVEDDAAVRLLIAELLRDLGYACVEATNAQGAMPILASGRALDLLITDVGLPGLNGRQLAEYARQQRPDLKVLFVTGYAESATGASPFLEPGMDMVTKPFTLDALALKIREILPA
jgi:PAS domain S-box-containing protein